jgi:hypothetical protein
MGFEDNNSIKVSGDVQYPCSYQLYNIAGQRIKSAILDNPASYIDVSALATGHYILNIANNGSIHSSWSKKR